MRLTTRRSPAVGASVALALLLAGCSAPETVIDNEPDDDCTALRDWDMVEVVWSLNISWQALQEEAPDLVEAYHAAEPTPDGTRMFGGDCEVYGDDVANLSALFWAHPDAQVSHTRPSPTVKWLVFAVPFPDGDGYLMFLEQR